MTVEQRVQEITRAILNERNHATPPLFRTDGATDQRPNGNAYLPPTAGGNGYKASSRYAPKSDGENMEHGVKNRVDHSHISDFDHSEFFVAAFRKIDAAYLASMIFLAIAVSFTIVRAIITFGF